MLGLVFGVTVYAASTVWAVFMGGLAVGSLVAGRLADVVRRPLVWLAGAEIGIALTAASTPFLFGRLMGAYADLLPLVGDRLLTLTAFRFAIAVVVLLVPTTLMGATLPLVLKTSAATSERLGRHASLLYGINTAGAIAGTVAAGFYFIPNAGMTATFRFAGIANLVVAGGALLLARTNGLTAAGQEAAAARTASTIALSLKARRLVLLAFAISGAASLGFEIIWLRVVLVIGGPSVYTISMVLATVLAGIALGSWLAVPLMKRQRPLMGVLVAAELAVAFGALQSMAIVPRLPDAIGQVPPAFARLFPDYLVPVLTSSVLVALLTSVSLGFAFPIGLHLWGVNPDDPGDRREASRVGVFYALNVCGAIVGSLLTGFVLLPGLGVRGALIGLAASVLVSGLLLLAVKAGRPMVRLGIALLVLAAFGGSAWFMPDPMAPLLVARHPGQPVMWLEESVQSTVSVQSLGRRHAMYVDGSHQADDTGSLSLVHFRIGTLPFALHPNPQRAMVVGLGGGATAGAASSDPRVQLDIVELSTGVVHASEFFKSTNFDVLRKPNVRLRIDDARTHLALSKNRYDIITADTIQPTRAGAASLYSTEYFELVRDALRDDGIALQWFSGTEMEYKLVARTFLKVFPDATAWTEDGSLLIAKKRGGPVRLRADEFNMKLGSLHLREAFARIGVNKFDDLVGLFRAGSDDLRRFVGEGMVLSDDQPILEYFLSLPRAPFDPNSLRGDVGRYLAP